MRTLLTSFSFLCCIVPAVAGDLPIPSAVAAQEISLEKQEEPAFYSTHYLAKNSAQDASATSCQIVWTVRRPPRFSNGFSFSEKSACPLELPAQQAYRTALLAQLLKDAPGLAGVRGFAWGSLLRGDGNDAFAKRMRDVLSQDKQWKSASKRRGFQQAAAYQLLPKILQEKKIFAELHALFAEHGLQLRVGEVEKIQFDADGLPMNFLLYFRFGTAP